MICRECQLAGDAKALGNTGRAVEMHKLCTHSESCTCQHYVGKGTIPSAEAEESREGSSGATGVAS